MIMTKILRNIEVPTGNILIVRGENGKELNVSQLGITINRQTSKLISLGCPMKLTV